MSPQETLVLYTNPPYNIFGTAVFLSYIALALLLTTRILLLITHQSQLSHSPFSSRNAAATAFLVALSLISFASLSYHMLSFLIKSFLRWRMNKLLFKPDDVGGGFGQQLWSWMLESSLFEGFARELVGGGAGVLWTQIALLGTCFWNVWMAGRAKAHGVPSRTMASFLGLSQILPISFTATLFLLYLHFMPSAAAPLKASEQPAQGAAKADSQPSTARPKVRLLVATIVFNALLLALPSSRESSAFIPMVLFTRLLLLLPHLGMTQTPSSEEWISAILLSGGFVVANVSLLGRGAAMRDIVNGLWRSGAAVKALGWDAVIGLLAAGWIVYYRKP